MQVRQLPIHIQQVWTQIEFDMKASWREYVLWMIINSIIIKIYVYVNVI